MLVLTRKIGEKINIGSGIVVTLVEINRDRVRLAFEAPREVPIFRQELQAEKAVPKTAVK